MKKNGSATSQFGGSQFGGCPGSSPPRTRIKAILPQMATAAVALVKTHRVPPVGLSQRQGARGRLPRDSDEVDMVRHQPVTRRTRPWDHKPRVVSGEAVAQQRHTMLLTLLPQSLDVKSPVFVNQEDVLTIVAPLGDVVRNALHDHTGHSRHRRMLSV
jgi:hypothetical protein